MELNLQSAENLSIDDQLDLLEEVVNKFGGQMTSEELEEMCQNCPDPVYYFPEKNLDQLLSEFNQRFDLNQEINKRVRFLTDAFPSCEKQRFAIVRHLRHINDAEEEFDVHTVSNESMLIDWLGVYVKSRPYGVSGLSGKHFIVYDIENKRDLSSQYLPHLYGA